MNVLKRLAVKNLKKNKKRTISTAIGIILSTALICGTATLVTSFQKTLVQNAINERGYYHVSLVDVTEEQIKEVKANRNIKNILETEEVGYGILQGCKNEDKPYARVLSMTENTFKDLKFKLTERKNCTKQKWSSNI